WSSARPHATAAWRPVADLLGGEIVRIEVVRIAAATLGGHRVDDAVDQIQCVRFAVGRHEERRWFDLVTGGDIELAQPAVPGHSVGDVFAGRDLVEHGSCGEPAGTQYSDSRVRLFLKGAIEVPLPQQGPLCHVDAVDVVGYAGDDGDFLVAVGRADAAGDE